MILEELEHAKARGARVYCEMVGIGFTADAHHITAPPEGGDGAVRSMRAVDTDAEATPALARIVATPCHALASAPPRAR